MHVLRQFPEQLAAQVLGRIGDGRGSLQPLAGLTRSAQRWLGDADITCIVASASGLIVAGCADGAVHFLREVR